MSDYSHHRLFARTVPSAEAFLADVGMACPSFHKSLFKCPIRETCPEPGFKLDSLLTLGIPASFFNLHSMLCMLAYTCYWFLLVPQLSSLGIPSGRPISCPGDPSVPAPGTEDEPIDCSICLDVRVQGRLLHVTASVPPPWTDHSRLAEGSPHQREEEQTRLALSLCSALPPTVHPQRPSRCLASRTLEESC